MVRLFEVLEKSDKCYGNILDCLSVESDEFSPFTFNSCGFGTAVSNVFSKDNAYVYSSQTTPFTIDVKLFYHKVKPLSYFIETRTNIGTGCYWTYPTKFSLEGSNNGVDWK